MENFSIWNAVMLMGASQGVLLGALLLLKRNSNGASIPLGVSIILMSVDLLFKFLYDTGLIIQTPYLIYLSEPFNMLFGALIVVYVRSQMNFRLSLKRSDWLLLVPFFVYIIYYMPFYVQNSADKLYDLDEFMGNGISSSENLWEWVFEVVVNLFFLVVSWRMLRRYHKKIRDVFSDVEKINYFITQKLIIIGVVAYMLEILLIVLAFTKVEQVSLYNNYLYAILLVTIYLIGYDGLTAVKQPLPKAMQEEVHALDEEQVKYRRSSLNGEQSEAIKHLLVSVMVEHRPYLNPEIRLNDLAELVNAPSHHLSQVINEKFEQNFFEFINGYRVEEAKRLLKDSSFKNYSLTAIGFEVGFNSKSAFYTAFKKLTGTTPAKF